MEPALNHVLRDRQSRTATQIKDARSFRQLRDETIVPRFIVPFRRSPVGIPGVGVTLIMINDVVGPPVHTSESPDL